MRISLEQLKTFSRRFLRALANHEIFCVDNLEKYIGEGLTVDGTNDVITVTSRETPIGIELHVGYLPKNAGFYVLSFRVYGLSNPWAMQTRCCVNIPGYKTDSMDKSFNLKQVKVSDFPYLSITKGELEKLLEI